MFLRGKTRFDPFGKLRSALERFPRQLAHPAVGEPFRQRIDRLADRWRQPLPRLGDLRMNDLPFIAILLELARDDARLALGKLPLRPPRIVEIDEADRVPAGVGREDTGWSAARRSEE